ncbi:hypothetical protein EXT61_23725, partial [Pectobacterium parmentieri]|nr:hypothetical protein [Pectobacterium parmentieri]
MSAPKVEQGEQIPDPHGTVVELLKAGEVIPDVIPEFRPSLFFSIIFPGFSTSATEITMGTTYERDRTLKEPEIEVVATVPELLSGSLEGNQTYTIVMTDPDAPSKQDPKFGEWRHWVTTGVKLPKAGSGVTFAAKTKPASTPYEPPAPPPGSGPHRYVVLMFQEPEGFTIPPDAVECKADLDSRPKWNAMKFA